MVAPMSETYVWARNDGQRMAGNPRLLQQGKKDQADCRMLATRGSILNQARFADCMRERGYAPRRAG